jgi:S-adenosylmethionine:tRNA ribosyltransferase-isomerase
MKPARSPRSNKLQERLLVVRPDEWHDSLIQHLPEHLRAGDLLVVNDAATLPAALHGQDRHARPVELRLLSQVNEQVWQAVTLGAGDWHLPTEARPAPPQLPPGAEIIFSGDFRAKVLRANPLSRRFVEVEFNLAGESLWRNLYRQGKPVQYSYLDADLKLWSVQNIYSSRPWAVEMPSAGHALTWQLLLQLRKKGVRIVALTHGAGLSATGAAAIDQALPLGERFEIPAATMEAVEQAKRKGGRVIAVGTSVVRALESAALGLSGTTHLKIGPAFERQIVDGLLTGTHDVSESHYQLLRAFLSDAHLQRLSDHLDAHHYLTHEFGDSCLLLDK